jgi:hypothetical protein
LTVWKAAAEGIPYERILPGADARSSIGPLSRNDAIETLNFDRMNRIYRMEKIREATARELQLLAVAF